MSKNHFKINFCDTLKHSKLKLMRVFDKFTCLISLFEIKKRRLNGFSL